MDDLSFFSFFFFLFSFFFFFFFFFFFLFLTFHFLSIFLFSFFFFFFFFSFFLVPTLHRRPILPCFYIMPRSPPTKIRRLSPRPYPILPGSPLKTAPNAPKKNASSELPWTEQLKLIRKFDVWKEEMKRLGQKKPSVRLFEDT